MQQLAEERDRFEDFLAASNALSKASRDRANDICKVASCKYQYILDALKDIPEDTPSRPEYFDEVSTVWSKPPRETSLKEYVSSFDQYYESLSDKEKVEKLIEILSQSKIEHAQQLADRLKDLIEYVEEDFEDEHVSFESLRNFLKFIRNTKGLKAPSIILSPEHEICAQWRIAPNQLFTVAFLPADETQFVIIMPRPDEPERTESFSGTTSTELLMERVAPHDVLTWIME